MRKNFFWVLFLSFLLASLISSVSAEDKSSSREIRSLIKEGKYSQAASILRDNKHKAPPFLKDDIAYWLADIHYRQGKYTLAKKELCRIVRDFTGEDMADDALLLLGRVQMERGYHQKGLMTYEKVYRHYRDRETAPEALYLIAEYYLSKGDENKTIFLLNKIGREYPEYAKYREISELIEKIEDRRRKIEEAKSREQQRPRKKEIEVKPAPPQKPLTDKEKAKRYVEKRTFLPRGKKNRIYWHEKIIEAGEKELKELKEKGETTKAEQLKKYISHLYKYKAWEFASHDLLRQTIKAYEDLIRKYPNTRHAQYAELAVNWYYGGRGQYEKAIRGYRNFLQKYPNATTMQKEDAYYSLAYMLYRSGRKEEAWEDFKSYLQMFPEGYRDEWANFMIGMIKYELGNQKEAKEHFLWFKDRYPHTNFDYRKYLK